MTIGRFLIIAQLSCGLATTTVCAKPRFLFGGSAIAASLTIAQNNTELKSRSESSGPIIYRLGFATPGDGGDAIYYWSAIDCVSADDGAQVQPTGITGCWIADFEGMRPTPIIWGAIGNGTTDDSAKVQAAITARAGKALYLGPWKYNITVPLTLADSISIIGDGGKISPYATNCSTAISALIANSDINLLTLTGSTATIKNICFQMATVAGTRTTGYALKIGGTASTQMGHPDISGNTIVNAYDGILYGGNTTGTTQTNGGMIENNLIISPSHEGIAVGRESSAASNPATTLRDNQIVCFAAASNAIGIAFYDGAIRYYGADGGPYACNRGLVIQPGAVGGSGQLTMGAFDGVLGDSSITADLDINTTDPLGSVFYLKFVNAWASSASATDTPIRVRNTGGGSVKQITLAASTFHSGANQSTPIIDLQAGTNITITANTIVADGGGTTTGPAIKIDSAVQAVAISANFLGSQWGTLATGIQLPSSGSELGIWSITGNIINATTPISYTPSGETVTFASNIGIDNICPSVASAASISLTAPYNCINLTGTTTIQSLGTGWSNREVDVIALSGLTISSAPAANGMCEATNLVLAAGASARLKWLISPLVIPIQNNAPLVRETVFLTRTSQRIMDNALRRSLRIIA